MSFIGYMVTIYFSICQQRKLNYVGRIIIMIAKFADLTDMSGMQHAK